MILRDFLTTLRPTLGGMFFSLAVLKYWKNRYKKVLKAIKSSRKRARAAARKLLPHEIWHQRMIITIGRQRISLKVNIVGSTQGKNSKSDGQQVCQRRVSPQSYLEFYLFLSRNGKNASLISSSLANNHCWALPKNDVKEFRSFLFTILAN